MERTILIVGAHASDALELSIIARLRELGDDSFIVKIDSREIDNEINLETIEPMIIKPNMVIAEINPGVYDFNSQKKRYNRNKYKNELLRRR